MPLPVNSIYATVTQPLVDYLIPTSTEKNPRYFVFLQNFVVFFIKKYLKLL